jgi:hypothetical protein
VTWIEIEPGVWQRNEPIDPDAARALMARRLEIAEERRQISQGICPRSDKRIMPNGVLRPACSFCECGEES